MRVIIAEKPDQAMKLASPFAHRKQQGFIEVKPNRLFPKGAFFTWAVGHICELVPPEAYNPAWKKWAIQSLPLIPDTFRHQVMRSKAKQFGIIKQLLKRTDVKEIIHAGDAGREGELIVRTIIEQCGVRKPMKRLWISSLTERAVTSGFESLLDETQTRNLY
jgi:DNA topoisomerase III